MGEIVVYDDRGQKKDDFVFHHSKLQPRDSSLINTNKIGKLISKAKAKGVRVIGSIQMETNPWFLKRHPDCRVIQINKAAPGQNSYPVTITDLGCFNSPYGDYMIELMKEIITE